ncbi:MAG: hypothetical protein KA515_02165 [Candidatus Pacebacteria bacterium]|nr:hypothetical protein [Candidatus Paceibacterota bacterium]
MPEKLVTNEVLGPTVQSVENFYKFKNKIKVITDKALLIQLCKEEGIVIDEQNHDISLTELRKKILNNYLSIHFSKESSKTIPEQREKQESNMRQLTAYLAGKKSKSIVWIGGSLGSTEKTKSTQSDLDLFFALPRLEDEKSVGEESSIFKNLPNIGFIIINKDKSIAGIMQVLKTGRGLARISGMTRDGVELDFHCVGIDDLHDMDKLRPGWIERVPRSDDYFESRISFQGNHKVLPKLGDRLFNYLDSDGEMFKGFYPDNFSAGAKIFYDPTGDGEKISDNLWKAIVKAFLFHNNAYQRDASGKIQSIDRNHASFEDFLKTLHYQFPTDYNEGRLEYLKNKYAQVLKEIMEKFHLA